MARSDADDDMSACETGQSASDSDDKDDTCMKCGEGGKLLCCDGCRNAAHIMCVGLEAVPEEDWFCDVCCAARPWESTAKNDPGDLPSRPQKMPRCEVPRAKHLNPFRQMPAPPDKCPKVLIEDGPAGGWQIEIYISWDVTDKRGWAPRPIFTSPDGESTRAPKAFRRDATISLDIRQQVDKLYEKLRLDVLESSSAGSRTHSRSSQRPAVGNEHVHCRQARSILRAPDPFLEVCRQRFATAMTDCSFSSFSAKRFKQPARSIARATQHGSGELDNATAPFRPAPSPARAAASSTASLSSVSQILAGVFEGDGNTTSSVLSSDTGNLDLAWAAVFADLSETLSAYKLVERMLQEGSDQRTAFQRLVAVACSPKVDSILPTAVAIVSNGLLQADSTGFSSGNAVLGKLAAHSLNPVFAQQVMFSKTHQYTSPLALTAALGVLLGTLASESAPTEAVAKELERLLREEDVVQLGEISWSVWSHSAALLFGLLWSMHGRTAKDRLHQVHVQGPARFGLQLRHYQELVSWATEAAEEHERQLQSLRRSQDRQTCENEQGPWEAFSKIQRSACSQLPHQLRNELAERLLASRKPLGLGVGGFLQVAERLLATEGVAACSKRQPLGTMGELLLETADASCSLETRHNAAKQVCQCLSTKPWAQLTEQDPLKEEELLQTIAKLPEQDHQDAWCAVVAWACLGMVPTQLPFLCAVLMDFLCDQCAPSSTTRVHNLREMLSRLLLVQRALRCSAKTPGLNRQQQELELIRCVLKKVCVHGSEYTTDLTSIATTFRGLGSFANTSFALATSAEHLLQRKSPMQSCLLVGWVQLLQLTCDARVELASFLESLMSRAAHHHWARWQQGLMLLTGLCPGGEASALPNVARPSDTPAAAPFVACLWHRTFVFSLKLTQPPGAKTHARPPNFEMARDEELQDILSAMLEVWLALMAACISRPCMDSSKLVDAAQTDLAHCLVRRLLPLASGTRVHKSLRLLFTVWRDELNALCRLELLGGTKQDQAAWQKRLVKAESTSAAVAPVLASGDLQLQRLSAEIIALSFALCELHGNHGGVMSQLVKEHFCRALFPRQPLPEINVSSQGEAFCFTGSSKLARLNGKTFSQVYMEDQQFVRWSLNSATNTSPDASAGHQLVHRFARWVLCNVLESEPVWLAVWHRPAVPLSQTIAASRAAAHFFMSVLSASNGADSVRWLEAEAIDSALRLGCLLLAQGLPESPVWQDVWRILELGQGVKERKHDGTWRHAMTGLLKILMEHQYGGCGSHAVLARFIRDVEALLPLARGDAAKRHLQALQKIVQKRTDLSTATRS